MRVLIYGNAPWTPSGYGTQGYQLGQVLRRNGHDVAFAPFHGLQGAPLNWEGFTVFPGSGEEQWSLDLLPAHYRGFQADLLITLMDAWVLDPAKLQGMNVAHWMPVDCSPLSTMDRRIIDAGGGRPIAISKFGHKQMLDAGYDALYAPHALDLESWKPLPDRRAAKVAAGFGDRFLIGVNAANQDPFRKAFGEQLTAFKSFSDRHPEALMLIHTRGETRQGVNLPNFIARMGLQEHVILGDQYLISSGMVTDGSMVTWHGYVDFLSNVSYGEGFGLAVLQSQACGTPVIVNNWSAMTELCGSGWKVAGQQFWNRGHDAAWQVPFIREIGKAYEKAYQAWKDPAAYQRLSQRAREFSLAYDSDRVYAEHWKPILDELGPKPAMVTAGPLEITAGPLDAEP